MNRFARTAAGRFTPLIALFAGSAALTPVVRAADPVDVSPLVTDHTVAVARLDLTTLKFRPVLDWAVDTAKRAGVKDDDLVGLNQGGGALSLLGQPMIDSLVRQGVGELAFIVQAAEPPTETPILLLAVTKPANPQAAVTALAPLRMRSGQSGNLLVFSPNLPPGVLAKLVPVARPELTDARPAADTLALHAGFSDAVKAALSSGGKDAVGDQLLADVKTFALHIDTTAGPHLTAAAEATSPEAAVRLKALATKPQADSVGQKLSEIARSLPLTVNGSTLSLDARQHEIDTAAKQAKQMVPTLQMSRTSALRVQSASNERSLLMGMFMYANENKGNVAPDLGVAGKYLGAKADVVLTNPLRPELKTAGYVYLPPVEGRLSKIKNSAGRLVLYEAGDFGEGINCGFADGHVEFIKDKTRFDTLLAEAASPAK